MKVFFRTKLIYSSIELYAYFKLADGHGHSEYPTDGFSELRSVHLNGEVLVYQTYTKP